MSERFSLPLPEPAPRPVESTEGEAPRRFSLPMDGQLPRREFETQPPVEVAQPQPIQENRPEVLEGPRVGAPMARQAARIRAAHPQPQTYPMEDYGMVGAGSKALPQASDPSSILYYALPMADRASREQILRERFPNATFGEDRFGNPTVNVEGNTYYLERPDPLNPQNVRGAVMRAAPSVATSVAAAGLGPAGMLGTMVGQGLAGGAGNIISQLPPIFAGSGKPLDLAETATEAGLSAVTPFVPQVAREARRQLGNLGESVMSRLRAARPTPAQEFIGGTSPAATLPGSSETVRYEDLPRGAQSFLGRESEKLYPQTAPEVTRRVAAGQPGPFPEELAVAGAPKYPDIMPIDSDRLLGFAEREVARGTPSGMYINEQLQARAAGRPVRVSDDLEGAFGALTPGQAKFLEDVKNARQGYSSELSNAFANAPDAIDIPTLRIRLNTLARDAIPNTPEEAAIKKITQFFSGDQPLTLERLHRIKSNIDGLIKYGDQALSIQPGALANSQYQITGIRRDLDDILRQTSPDYARVMDKYSTSIDKLNAYEAGQNAFSKGGDLLRPGQTQAYLADADTSDAFRAGFRTAIEDKLRTSPNDLLAARRMVGGEGDYVRQNIAATFGADAVDQVLATAEREALYKATEDAIARAASAGSRGAGAAISEELQRPPIDLSMFPFPFQQMAAGAAQRAIHGAAHTLRGERGPEFERALTAFLTSRGPQTEEMMRGIVQRRMVDEAVRRAGRVAAPVAGIAGAETVRAADEQPRRAGGRVGRASGGRLMRNDHSARAVALIKAAEAAKKAHNATTEGILEQPDEAVAKALSIANKAI